ncbi:propanediol utilization protein [Rhodovulum tesquicola]|uniref:propanediol utilization protein n=1 Tax=Rhodovulum tesquicola TaxID=540254 RepID=UPI002096A69C|nr:propanediol utilization protein [Rhodovulum tesquicola]MCO8146685.1 propanediol utilization protein [Rhodovulum tesquicola]
MPRRACVAGHFGELLQGRLGPDGPVALVTLPCPVLTVTAEWRPGPDFGLWQGGRDVLTRGQLARLWRTLRMDSPRGRLHLRAGMPPGGGAGASTAALLAALRCLGGGPLPPEDEAALCLALEGASDPLMHPAPGRLIWAPRAGRVLADLPPLPALEVLGGFSGPGRRTDPGDTRFADIADLAAEMRQGPGRARLGALASESARRNHALRGGPDPAPVLAAGRQLGALGVAAAHTGAALGLIFAPGTVPQAAGPALRALGLSRLVRFRTGGRA